MNIFVDENIPLITVEALREKGHDVIDIRGTVDQGISDEALWQKVKYDKCLLITTDKGFSNHRNEQHYGLLIIRLKQPSRQKIHQRIMQAITKHPEQDWPGLMIIMRDAVQSTWKAQ